MVAINKELFIRSTRGQDLLFRKKRSWWKRAWDWVCDKGKKFVNTVKKAWNGIKSTGNTKRRYGTLKGVSKVVFKDAAKNFALGAGKEFALQKFSAWKHDKAHNIGDKVKKHRDKI
jgi:hypothetical protein